MMIRANAARCLAVMLALGSMHAFAADEEASRPARKLDVWYVPTPDAVVDRMLDTAKVKPLDVVYDLGCGDGRMVIAAAKKYGARGVGVDLDPARIREAKHNAKLVKIEQSYAEKRLHALKAGAEGGGKEKDKGSDKGGNEDKGGGKDK